MGFVKKSATHTALWFRQNILADCVPPKLEGGSSKSEGENNPARRRVAGLLR
jgi:hypothetical protein